MDPEYCDRAVILGETLVLADLHLGKGAASRVELPLGGDTEVIERIETLLDRFAPETVVLAGDVLHAFDYVPDPAKQALQDLNRAVRRSGADLVVLRGNHDTMLDSVWDGEVCDTYRFHSADSEETVVCHGHEPPPDGAECYVIGHDHPAIVIEGQKRHCYFRGESVYRDSDLLVVPAFNRLVEGVTVNGRIGEAGERSPLLTDIGQLRPIVYEREADETFEFPRLDRFQRLL